VAALTAYYNTEREKANDAHTARIAALRTEQEAIDNQVSALESALALSRGFRTAAEGLRDTILALQTGPASPLNPADQLALVQGEFENAVSRFWADPSADLASKVGQVGTDVIDALGLVYSRASDEYQAVFDAIVSTLGTVAAEAEARATPEEQQVAQLEALNAETTRIKDAMATADADHSAKLASIDAMEQASLAALKDSLGAVAERVVGVQEAVGATGWATASNTGGIWGATVDIAGRMYEVRGQLGELLGGTWVDKYIAEWTRTTADRVTDLKWDIHQALWDLVGSRIDALLQQGGPQAIADALKGPLDRTAFNTAATVANLYQIAHLIAYPGSTQSLSYLQHPQSHTGTWRTEGRTYSVLPEQMILPAPVATWFREHGPMAPSREGAAAAPITVNVTVNGARDPGATGREVEAAVRRAMDDITRGRGNALRPKWQA
jgi:hypothetical protein